MAYYQRQLEKVLFWIEKRVEWQEQVGGEVSLTLTKVSCLLFGLSIRVEKIMFKYALTIFHMKLVDAPEIVL